MRNETRQAFKLYINQVATLNGIPPEDVIAKFSVEPSIEQKLESLIQEKSTFLSQINNIGVKEQQGEKVGLGVSGTVASTTDTTAKDRATQDLLALESGKYHCEQINFDTHLRYGIIDQWAKFPDFQLRLANAIQQRIALDRIMIGWNGTSRAPTSDRAANPLLQDVKKGWLQNIREKAPARVMTGTKVGKAEEYKNLDALIYDATQNLIDVEYQDDPQLVAIIGRDLLHDKYFPIINKENPATEMLATDVVVSQKRIGGLPAIRVPYFPAGAVLITRLDNLSIYFQEGSMRRSIVDNAKRDQIEDYISSNLDFVVEQYKCAALIEEIELTKPTE